MDTDTYLAHLRRDAGLLAAAAGRAGPDAPVPTCPGWTVADLVGHVGAVYEHKIACLRLGRRPADDEWSRQPRPGLDGPAWLAAALDELVAELTERPSGSPAYTWQPRDQTVGFWVRRMAQETVIHRVDAELADGTVSPVDDELALDGVDEMLDAFLVGPWWQEDPVPAASGRTVAVRSAGRAWRATLLPTEVRLERDGPAGEADGVVTGAPYDVLMWVWGRPPAGDVGIDGDGSAVRELRERLAFVAD